jgi:hypothetical protein
MTSEQRSADLPFLKRSIAPIVYLIAAGIATLGWFYALGYGTWVFIGWMFG